MPDAFRNSPQIQQALAAGALAGAVAGVTSAGGKCDVSVPLDNSARLKKLLMGAAMGATGGALTGAGVIVSPPAVAAAGAGVVAGVAASGLLEHQPSPPLAQAPLFYNATAVAPAAPVPAVVPAAVESAHPLPAMESAAAQLVQPSPPVGEQTGQTSIKPALPPIQAEETLQDAPRPATLLGNESGEQNTASSSTSMGAPRGAASDTAAPDAAESDAIPSVSNESSVAVELNGTAPAAYPKGARPSHEGNLEALKYEAAKSTRGNETLSLLSNVSWSPSSAAKNVTWSQRAQAVRQGSASELEMASLAVREQARDLHRAVSRHLLAVQSAMEGLLEATSAEVMPRRNKSAAFHGGREDADVVET